MRVRDWEDVGVRPSSSKCLLLVTDVKGFNVKTTLVFASLFVFAIAIDAGAQVRTDSEARSVLREWGISSSKWIQNAQQIIVSPGRIEPRGGISIDLPILEFVRRDQIILLQGASGYVERNGTIVIRADILNISAVVIGRGTGRRLIVGRSLRDIVNWIIAQG